MTDRKKILIIEDDTAMGKILTNRLNEEGFVTFYEANGQDGLNRALKEHPDLIVLDLVLPMMSGLDVLKEVRKDEWGKTANIVIMTNLTNDEKLKEAFENGVYEYLVKANWDLGAVIEKVKSLLSAQA